MIGINKLVDIEHKYDDIITLPHHVSKKYKCMSIQNRSCQFAPFAALNGYSDEIYEASRLTYKKVELDDDVKGIINSNLLLIQEIIKDRPIVNITYFIPDNKKDGGSYRREKKQVKRLDNVYKKIIFMDNSYVYINDIREIEVCCN